MTPRIIAIASIVILATGCSTIKTNELSHDEAVSLQGRTLALSQYNELPDFPAQTAANVQFGLIGVATAISNGNSMIKNNKVEDPAMAISEKLAAILEKNGDIKIAEERKYFSMSQEAGDIASAYGSFDYVLDVKTTGWNSIYYTSDWDSYRILYSAHARVINTKSKEVVSEAVCNAQPEHQNTNDGPSYEDLENGVGLKKELVRAVDFCSEYLAKMMKFVKDS